MPILIPDLCDNPTYFLLGEQGLDGAEVDLPPRLRGHPPRLRREDLPDGEGRRQVRQHQGAHGLTSFLYFLNHVGVIAKNSS